MSTFSVTHTDAHTITNQQNILLQYGFRIYHTFNISFTNHNHMVVVPNLFL